MITLFLIISFLCVAFDFYFKVKDRLSLKPNPKPKVPPKCVRCGCDRVGRFCGKCGLKVGARPVGVVIDGPRKGQVVYERDYNPPPIALRSPHRPEWGGQPMSSPAPPPRRYW